MWKHLIALCLLLGLVSQTVHADPPDVATLIEQGKADLAQNNFKDAQQKFSKAIQQDGKNAEAFHGAGLAAMGLKEYPEAVSLLEKASKFSAHPDRAILLNLAIAEVQAKKPRDGAEAARKSLEAFQPVDLRGYETFQSAIFAAYLDQPDDLEALRTFWTTYTHKVDELKKDQKRWGETWENPDFVEKRRGLVVQHFKEMEDARGDITKWKAAIEALEKAVDNTESRGRHTGALGDRKQKLAHAKAELAKSQARYEDARKEFQASLPSVPHALDPLSMDEPMPTDEPVGSDTQRRGRRR